MGQHDAGASVLRGVGDDFPQGECRTVLLAGMARQMKAPRIAVDMGHPDVLAHRVGVGDAACEKAARGREAVELEWKFRTLKAHATDFSVPDRPAYSNRNRNGGPKWTYPLDASPASIKVGECANNSI